VSVRSAFISRRNPSDHRRAHLPVAGADDPAGDVSADRAGYRHNALHGIPIWNKENLTTHSAPLPLTRMWNMQFSTFSENYLQTRTISDQIQNALVGYTDAFIQGITPSRYMPSWDDIAKKALHAARTPDYGSADSMSEPTRAERNSKSLERIAESLESIALFLHCADGRRPGARDWSRELHYHARRHRRTALTSP
jgi:hypothetical protein